MLDCQLDKAAARHAAAADNNNNNGNNTAMTTKTAAAARPKRERVKLMGIRQHLEVQRVKQQEKHDPDSWFVRKFIIGIVVGVFGYSYYVYVVRLCVPMIRMQQNRLGARAQGLVYLVIYHVLFVMFVWTYLVAIATPPGFARDYVPETEPPQAEEEYITVAGQAFEDQLQPIRPSKSKSVPAELYHPASRDRRSTSSSNLSISEEEGAEVAEAEDGNPGSGGVDGGHGALEMSEAGGTRAVVSALRAQQDEQDRVAETMPTAGAFGPTIGTAIASATADGSSAADPTESPAQTVLLQQQHKQPTEERSRCQLSESTTLAPSPSRPEPAHVATPTSRSRTSNGVDRVGTNPSPIVTSASRSPSSPRRSSYLHFPDPPPELEPPKPLAVERIPRSVPVLTEQYRYDPREGIVRPYRSHRCKHCAKVVLKMDHHCPWVGSCVGARNYKYFYNFLQWSSAYLLFVCLTLVIAQTLPLGTFPATRPYPGVDGQQLAIIALSFFFLFFTGSLLVQHTGLILRNMTTIEQIGLARMRQRERAALASEYGFFGFRAKKATRREWDRRWGRPDREGNLWWLGSSRANWEMVLGKAKPGWFLPIPAKPTMDDGLHYTPNPRFSPEGYWRERRFWPAELR
ncbi:hypothetical protein JCM3774_001735 [Rhodotorula dairenensis]